MRKHSHTSEISNGFKIGRLINQPSQKVKDNRSLHTLHSTYQCWVTFQVHFNVAFKGDKPSRWNLLKELVMDKRREIP